MFSTPDSGALLMVMISFFPCTPLCHLSFQTLTSRTIWFVYVPYLLTIVFPEKWLIQRMTQPILSATLWGDSLHSAQVQVRAGGSMSLHVTWRDSAISSSTELTLAPPPISCDSLSSAKIFRFLLSVTKHHQTEGYPGSVPRNFCGYKRHYPQANLGSPN